MDPIVKPPATVPSGPGIPAMPPGTKIASTITMLAQDGQFIARLFMAPQWGIFSTDGQSYLTGDAVRGVEYRKEAAVSDYKIEQGAFASYNKVQVPVECRVTFMNSGSGGIVGQLLPGLAAFSAVESLVTGRSAQAEIRNKLMSALDQLIDSLTLVQVVTPEFRYPSMTVIRHNYRREARDGSATNIALEVWLKEIRQTGTSTYKQTTQPDGAQAQAQGSVQTQTPTVAQSKAAGPLVGAGDLAGGNPVA